MSPSEDPKGHDSAPSLSNMVKMFSKTAANGVFEAEPSDNVQPSAQKNL